MVGVHGDRQSSERFINAKCTRKVVLTTSDKTKMNGQAERQEGLLTLQ